VAFIQISSTNISIQGRLIRTARLDAEKFQFVDDPRDIVDGLKRHLHADLFTFMQRLPDTSPRHPYRMEWDNLAVLPVSTFDEWWTKQIGFKARNKAKQASKKGVLFREIPFDDSLVDDVWEVFNENPVRQGKPFLHYGKDVEAVRKHLGTYLDSSTFVGAFLDGKMIGFIKLVTDQTRTQAGLMQIVSMIKYRDLAPTNGLVAEAVRYCADHHIPHLVYSHFSYGKKQGDSLTEFKERNGFKQVNLPRYYIPLTHIGSMALRLGLHHRFADRVPEALARPIRNVRRYWYERLSSVS
jgi:hypothetical protein